MRKMPPLNALKAFEAAARHQSFTKASEELKVTQAAISHQVRTLEDYCGLALFVRSNQKLRLTAAGRAYLPKLTMAFDLIADGYLELEGDKQHPRINIRTSSSFAVHWLVPRLDDFKRLYPEVDIRLSAQDDDLAFFPDEFDIEVRYLIEPPHHEHSQLLFRERIFPVCSPGLASGEQPLQTPADLANHELLHINFYPEDWAMWLQRAEVEDIDCERGHRFDQTVLTLAAAEQGLGVAMGRTPLVNGPLAEGRLVKPFELSLESTGGYWLLTRPDSEDREQVKGFCQWLVEASHQYEL